MTTLDYIPTASDPRETYLNISYRVKSWLLTVDHKRIGILYLIAITIFFFVLIPSIPATLGNFLVPLMVGARDLAFPRLNLMSWYLFMIGGTIAVIAAVTGGV